MQTPAVHRPAAMTQDDAPPPYSIFDPAHPIPSTSIQDPINRSHWRYRISGIRNTSNRMLNSGQSPRPGVQDIARGVKKSVKEIPKIMRERRARKKLAWLEKRDFLSDQGRLL
ncbi:hypothetical protein B0J11DRAFT_523123, partial [Dendryphion nanum]